MDSRSGSPDAGAERRPAGRPDPRRVEKWLLRSGAAFAVAQLGVLVYFAVAVASKWPPVGAPAAERLASYIEHWDAIRLANFLLPLPTPLFLLFLGGLHGVLRRAEGGTGALAVATLAAGIASAMVWPLGMVLGALAMAIGPQGGDPVIMAVLEGAGPLTLGLSGLPRAVFVGGASALVLLARCGPRWLGWLGLVVAVLCMGAAAVLWSPAAFPIAGLAMLLFLGWVLLASVALHSYS